MSFEVQAGPDAAERTEDVGNLMLVGDAVLADAVTAERARTDAENPKRQISSESARHYGAMFIGAANHGGNQPNTMPFTVH